MYVKLVHPLIEKSRFSSLPFSQFSSDWLPLVNRSFKWHVGLCCRPYVKLWLYLR